MNSKIEDLQLRGIAIAMVLFGHFSISSTLLESIDKALSNPFYWGVELFFVLSGYVVTKSLRAKSYDPLHFVIKRIFRLYPAIIALLVLSALINAIIINSTYADFIKQLFSVHPTHFAKNATSVLGGWLINSQEKVSYQLAQMWSLSVEFQFYAFLVIVIAFLPDRLRRAGLATTASLVFVASFFYRIEVGLNLTGYRFGMMNYLIEYKFDFMAAGVLLAMIPNLEDLFKKMPRSPYFVYFTLLVVTVTLMFVRNPLAVNTSPYDTLNGMGMLVCLVGSCFLVAYGAGGGLAESRAFTFLRNPLIKLGDVSYTIYIFHFSVFVISWIIINTYLPQAFSNAYYYGIAQFLFSIVLLVPLVLIVYKNIELIGIEFGEKIIKKFGLGVFK